MPTHAATAGKKKMKTGVDNYCDSTCRLERDVAPAIRQTKRWADGARYNYCDSTCRLENYRFRSQEKDSFQSQYIKVDTKRTTLSEDIIGDHHPLGIALQNHKGVN